MWTWVLPLLGGGVFLYAVGRYNIRSVLREWESLLTPEGQRALAALRDHVELDALLAQDAHAKARRERRRQRFSEAARLLDLAARVIAQAVPDRLGRLRAMAVCSRMVAALLPMRPLLPRSFRLRELASVAGICALLHHLLVASEERFRLRLWAMAAGYRIVLGIARRSASTVESGADGSEVPWGRFDAALSDFQALDREHVESFRVLLLALQHTP
jgi:hypothetical protein